MDPLLPALVATLFSVILAGIVFRHIRLPQIATYLLVGVCLGPHALGVIPEPEVVRRLGEFGVVLLLFFLGMEMSVPKLLSSWRVTILGTLVQIGVSVGLLLILGALLEWTVARSILVGFVISLSSTAIVVQLLRDTNETESSVGQDVSGILLVQDLAIVGMVITVGVLGGHRLETGQVALQVLGAVIVLASIIYIGRGGRVRLPLGGALRSDHELQVFAAFGVCFGLALVSAVLGLSTAVGAFVAGIVVAAARETEWIHERLEPFRVVLLAFFFVSVGMLLDLRFLAEHVGLLAILTALVFLTNTVINALILRLLGRGWPDSWYGGALLAQIGEFSFVLASIGVAAGVITDFGYHLTIAVIALSLLVAPLWSSAFRRFHRRRLAAGTFASATDADRTGSVDNLSAQ